jgi:hypothetical protein
MQLIAWSMPPLVTPTYCSALGVNPATCSACPGSVRRVGRALLHPGVGPATHTQRAGRHAARLARAPHLALGQVDAVRCQHRQRAGHHDGAGAGQPGPCEQATAAAALELGRAARCSHWSRTPSRGAGWSGPRRLPAVCMWCEGGAGDARGSWPAGRPAGRQQLPARQLPVGTTPSTIICRPQGGGGCMPLAVR